MLTQRVLRLLLDGAPPARILCLTFTKAAAANMADRVFRTLAKWTRLSDEALAAEIVAAGARGARRRARLAFARRLFARTIETPGGLKIQTIHAFCERLLHLFPFEANVAAGFRVVEEREAAQLMERARAEALTAALREGGAAATMRPRSPAKPAPTALKNCCARRSVCAPRSPKRSPIGAMRSAMARRSASGSGSAPGEDAATIEAAMLAGLGGRDRWVDVAAQLAAGGKKDNELALALRHAQRSGAQEAALESYLSVFFTKAGEPRGGADRRIITKPLETRFPGLLARLQAEQERLIALRDRRKAAQTVARSRDLARHRRVHSFRLCPTEGGARPARFRRSDRAHIGAAEPIGRRLGAL